MPIGYIGDDGLVTSMAKWDLDPQGPFVEERVRPVPEAEFAFSSLSLARPSDWKLYYRRQIRYSLRHHQNLIMREIVTRRGLQGLPQHVNGLYAEHDLSSLRRRRGLDGFFDRIAIRHIYEARQRALTDERRSVNARHV